MGTHPFLQWHYIIFLLPFGLAAIMLVFSAISSLGDGDADTEDNAGRAADGDADAGDSDVSDLSDNVDVDGDSDNDEERQRGNGVSAVHPLLEMLGVGRAPLVMVVETLFLSWGFCGFWANQLLLKTPTPSLTQMLPSFAIAFGGGIVGARVSSELIYRLLPQEESAIISRESLYGLTGRVTFPVSQTGGRIRVYDRYGTIHDHSCRVQAGRPDIPKGRQAIIMDRDRSDNLIVEEVAGGEAITRS